MDKKSAILARRTHIIEAALSCFLEKGYNQTGIRDIAKKAQISLGNLYNHFASKKAVLIEIASIEAKEIDDFQATLSDHSAPEATLRKFLSDYTESCNQADYVRLMFEIMGEAVRDEDIANLFDTNYNRLLDSLTDLLNEGHAQGTFRAQEDMREIAAILLDATEGYAVRSVLSGNKDKHGGAIMQNFLMQSVLKN